MDGYHGGAEFVGGILAAQQYEEAVEMEMKGVRIVININYPNRFMAAITHD